MSIKGKKFINLLADFEFSITFTSTVKQKTAGLAPPFLKERGYNIPENGFIMRHFYVSAFV